MALTTTCTTEHDTTTSYVPDKINELRSPLVVMLESYPDDVDILAKAISDIRTNDLIVWQSLYRVRRIQP